MFQKSKLNTFKYLILITVCSVWICNINSEIFVKKFFSKFSFEFFWKFHQEGPILVLLKDVCHDCPLADMLGDGGSAESKENYLLTYESVNVGFGAQLDIRLI